MDVKPPPIRMFLPLPWTVMAKTLPLGPGLKVRSREPSALMRARLETAYPVVDPLGASRVNVPPMRIWLFETSAIASMLEFVLGLKAPSSVPSGFRRAMLPLAMPSTELNEPPMMILPSGCTTIAWTGPLTVAPNVESSEPFALSLARKFWVEPAMLRKVPPTSTCPFGRTAVVKTVPLAVGVEGRVRHAERVHPRDVVPRRGGCRVLRLDAREVAPEDDASVLLDGDRVDRLVGVRGVNELSIEPSVLMRALCPGSVMAVRLFSGNSCENVPRRPGACRPAAGRQP